MLHASKFEMLSKRCYLLNLLLVLSLFFKLNQADGQDLAVKRFGEQSTSNSTNVKIQLYPNHRMDPTNRSDHLATESVLRPQLAVSIYANPLQHNTNIDHTSRSDKEFQRPLSHGLVDRQKHSVTNAIPQIDLSQQRGYRAPSGGETQIIQTPHGDFSMTKLNPWHYITDQTSPQSSGTAQSDSTTTQSNYDPHGPTMINAIISVPLLDQNQRQPEHQVKPSALNSQSSTNQVFEADPLQNLTSNNIDQTISRLLEAQSAGNIEFSMNLNGDEIILNPLYKSSNSSSAQDDSSPSMRNSRQLYNGRDDRSASGALRKHISSDLAGIDQSASEIDSIDNQVDENYTNDSETDYDTSVPSRSQSYSSTVTNSGVDQRNREDEPESNGSTNRVSKEQSEGEPEGSRSSNQAWSEPTGNRASNEEEVRYSSSPSSSSPLYDDDDTNDRSNSKTSRKLANDKKQASTRRFKSSKHQQSTSSSTNLKMRSSPRKNQRPTSTTNDRSYTHHDDERGSRGSAQPSVVIRGEDLKKFEQLLESLRSMSMVNLDTAKSRRSNRLSESDSARESRSSNGENVESDSGREEDEAPQQGNKRWSSKGYELPSSGREPSSSNNRLSPSKVSSSPERDCDGRKYTQSKMTRLATNDDPIGNTYDPELGPSNEQETTGADALDDLNDEGSQNIISEKQLVDPYSLDDSVHTKDLNESRSTSEHELDPGTVLMRQTILKNYYDNNAKHANGKKGSDDLEAIHKTQHDEQHERHLSSITQTPVGSSTQPDGSDQAQETAITQRQEGQMGLDDSTSSGQYIDYNQLNNRDTRRGEGQKAKITEPRDQMNRMRTLQLILEKAVFEASKRRASGGINQ